MKEKKNEVAASNLVSTYAKKNKDQNSLQERGRKEVGQHQNYKRIAPAFCSAFVLIIARQNVTMDLFLIKMLILISI